MNQVKEYVGIGDVNLFEGDPLLQAWVKRSFPAKTLPKTLERLKAYGDLCGKVLPPLVEEANRDENLPKLVRYDRWGKRIDEIAYCEQQYEARKLVLEAGVLPPVPFKERMAKAYLLNQNGEGGVACPLAMTDGLAGLLLQWGSDQQKKRYLPLLDDSSVSTPLTGGQFVTERQSGSNVSENEALAVPAPDGSWRLTGLKWFCSNPGELWVTTAKPVNSNSVALFLVPRRLPDGSLNECYTLRIKDLCGTRGKATAEVEYKNAYAELIGRPLYGMAILLETVLKTSRIHVAAGSLGLIRRAFLEARVYAENRFALGGTIAGIPHVADTLRRMEARWTACFLAFSEEMDLIEAKDPAADVLIPLLKIHISIEATQQVREAQIIFAGHGILRDFSPLPRLSQDALIYEIWEGTHAILASHVAKALRRNASRAAFDALIERCEKAARRPGLELVLAALLKEKKRLSLETEHLALFRSAFRALTLGLLARESGGPLEGDSKFSLLAASLVASHE